MSAFNTLWNWLTAMPAPAEIGARAPTAPIAPRSSERYLDVNAQRTQEDDARHEHAATRVCAVNNANVTRNYGSFKEDHSYQVAPLTLKEETDVALFMKPERHAAAQYVHGDDFTYAEFIDAMAPFLDQSDE